MKLGNRIGRSSTRGSTVVEFAVVLTVLLTMVFGIIDFGRAVYSYHFVSNAAREATRFASVRGNPSCKTPRTFPTETCPTDATSVSNYVNCPSGTPGCPTPGMDHTGIYIDPAAANNAAGYLNVATTWTGKKGDGVASCTTGSTSAQPTKDVGCQVIVTVQYNYGFSLPYLTQLGPLVIKSTSKFVISQ
jgi:Flp pilus assembly protein TadG